MFTYKGKTVKIIGLLGYGKSNKGIYEYLTKHNSEVRFILRADAPTDTGGAKFERVLFGDIAYKRINEDVLFLSPSARREKPEILFAERRGVMLSSDAEFFLSRTKSDVYAVSGSDGKSTTTNLTAMMLSDSYPTAIPCGNIGEAMTPHLDDPPRHAYVAELSSFQLMYMKPYCRRALITNITKNHLNWHSSFEEYINAKRNIFENAGERIINFDCEISRGFAKDYRIFAVFSKKSSEEELRCKIKADLYVTERDGFIFADGERMLSTKEIRVVGEHNVLNFMSAIAMSYGLCGKERILETARSFKGLAHRREFIGEHDGVRYYNSSIDSSPKRTVATLRSFDGRVIVILGGKSKGLDFAELVPTLLEKAKAIVIMGECAEEIVRTLSKSSVFGADIPYSVHTSLSEAVGHAALIANPGDTVLLSPSATSYDEFKNFEERGDAFRRIIKDL